MKIFFTGATSFTGMWFIKTLAKQGHQLYTLLNRKEEDYTALRKERLNQIKSLSTPFFKAPFGSDSFFKELESLPEIDLFCHHAADVTHYKSPDFNVVSALESNTHALPRLLKLLRHKGCSKLILTGSVFEPGEGKGSDHLRAVSPYGLSKGLTTAYFKYYCELEEIELKHFVIPNPFGPLEEFRFTSFLAKTWLEDKTAPVTLPNYVRDNIPVDLLAKAYSTFIEDNTSKLSPSFYTGSQEAFVHRFQKEMQPRLNKSCDFHVEIQTDFSEPLIRTNIDLLNERDLNWNEKAFWDELALYYLKQYT